MSVMTTERRSSKSVLISIKKRRQPLIDYYAEKGIMHDVVGSGGIDDHITEAIMAVINGKK